MEVKLNIGNILKNKEISEDDALKQIVEQINDDSTILGIFDGDDSKYENVKFSAIKINKEKKVKIKFINNNFTIDNILKNSDKFEIKPIIKYDLATQKVKLISVKLCIKF